jgi:lipopolysaccharide/colanic/teichoic acid biosynthesis glycosyltransferase
MPLQKSSFFWKRAFDALFSLTLFVVLIPVGILFFLSIAFETRAFPVYIQER